MKRETLRAILAVVGAVLTFIVAIIDYLKTRKET